MNKLRIRGEWNDLKGRAKAAWGEPNDDDLARIEGDRDRLVGAVQKRHGPAQEEAGRQVDARIARH